MNQVSRTSLQDAPTQQSEPRVDGRRQRSVRTRQAIIHAYMAVLQERRDLPTYEQVAQKAGLSERAVFAHFADREGLACAAFDYVLEMNPMTPAGDNLTADRTTRIRFQVEVRARTCELWRPVWKVVSIGLNKSAEVTARIDILRERFKLRLRTMYAPELETLEEPQRSRLFASLDALTSIESWERLRDHHDLTYEQACLSWVEAIDRLLPPTP